MRASAQLTAAPPLTPGGPCRLIRRRDAAPVAWRSTPDAVYLVGTSATPVGRDQVSIDIAVEAGATLCLRSAAATVAWRGAGTAQHIGVTLADGATLDWHPEPFIATAGCHHRQQVNIQLAGRSRTWWREELILGRHGEGPGRLDLRLDADLDGQPLLRHQLALGPGLAGWDGPALVGQHRCVGLLLDAGRDAPRPSGGAGRVPGGTWAALDLEGPGTLYLALADDLPALRCALDAAAPSTATSDHTAVDHTAVDHPAVDHPAVDHTAAVT